MQEMTTAARHNQAGAMVVVHPVASKRQEGCSGCVVVVVQRGAVCLKGNPTGVSQECSLVSKRPGGTHPF